MGVEVERWRGEGGRGGERRGPGSGEGRGGRH